MSQILENLRKVDPNDSDAVKEIITAFFQNLPKHTEVNNNVWLRVLETVITRFPRYCGQHRTTIENFIVHFIDSPNYYNVIEAGKSAHALQQIRPSQDKTATAKNCWREQMSILCNTAHKLIEALFPNTFNISKDGRTDKMLTTQLLTAKPLTTVLSQVLNVKKSQNATTIDRNEVLCNRLRNVFVFIQAMLVEVYPVAKPVQPQLILEVILQALNVSSSVNTDVTQASVVKTQALRTIDAMILCLGPNLIPFSALVFKCVMQTLRWSSDYSYEESRKVRCAAYKTLNRWLSTLHVHRISNDGRTRSWEDEITNHIITDITPQRKTVELTMSNQYTKKLSKKARRKLANSMLEQSSISSYMPGEKNKATVPSDDTNDEVSNAALELLEIFLTVCGVFLKPTTHKIFQERLVRECFNLEQYSTSRAIRLLRSLEACRKNCGALVPPPTQYLLHLYSTLINSQCDEIKKFSSEAILDIRLHLHCSPPSLNFALEVQQEKKEEEKRKRLSEKNRVALEKLLGKERVPQPDIITIADEPSNKRQRLDSEVVSDNISISSDSDKSIEISDDDADMLELIEQDNVEVDKETQNGIEVSDQTEESGVIEETNCNLQEKDVINDDNSNTNNEETDNIEKDYVEAMKTTIAIENEDDVLVSNDDESSKINKHISQDNEPQSDSNIYEAKTQVPLSTSADTLDGDKSPVSMEIAYDINVVNEVNVLEKIDDDNLPSTNYTDDVQITCGQAIQTSQDNESEKTKESEDIPKANGVNEANAVENNENEIKIVENNENEIKIVENIEVKIVTKEMSVDDMLADFVDEVNEESITEV